jgi:DNA-binding NarL/FixJ family response regulator
LDAQLSVLVVDDHRIILDELRTALEAEDFRVAMCRDAETAWNLVQTNPPDAAIIDIAILPSSQAKYQSNNTHGLNLARRIKLAHPPTGLVIFSHYEYHLGAFKSMLDLGMTGLAYRLKTSSSTELVRTLRQVCAGHVVIDPDAIYSAEALDNVLAVQDVMAQFTSVEQSAIEHGLSQFHELTPQERRTAYLSAASNQASAIALRMGIERSSVENYLSRVYDKLGFHALGPHLKKDVLLAKTCLIRDLQQLRPKP